MTRRSFLKALLVTGAVSALGVDVLDKDNILLSLEDYPEVTYERDWIPRVQAYQHTMYMTRGSAKVYRSEIADYETLHPELINDMLSELRGFNG